jgi:HSP20 family molecular chaperone IbpA
MYAQPNFSRQAGPTNSYHGARTPADAWGSGWIGGPSPAGSACGYWAAAPVGSSNCGTGYGPPSGPTWPPAPPSEHSGYASFAPPPAWAYGAGAPGHFAAGSSPWAWRGYPAPDSCGPLACPPGNGIPACAIEVRETDRSFEVTAELPGVDVKDVDVEITQQSLTIRGEKNPSAKDGQGTYYAAGERCYGAFLRMVPLPFPVNPDRVTAQYDRGVLRIVCDKTTVSDLGVRRVDIKAA